MKSQNANVLLRSKLPNSIQFLDVILLDTTGELSRVYSAADIVFIGKSLKDHGGQNPIEPAAWGKPVLFGPNMQNFRDVSALLLKAEAAIMISDEESIYRTCLQLCESPQLREQMGSRAQEVVRRNQGALERIMDTLNPVLQISGKSAQ